MSLSKAAASNVALVTSPSLGPAIVSVFGVDVPVLALSLSLLGLILARMVAPPASRKLSKREDVALTILLCIVLFLAVTGQITGRPLGVGMSFVWAVGLGFSGILIIEAFGSRVRESIDLWIGRRRNDNDGGQS